jgi:hypothetical protein
VPLIDNGGFEADGLAYWDTVGSVEVVGVPADRGAAERHADRRAARRTATRRCAGYRVVVVDGVACRIRHPGVLFA